MKNYYTLLALVAFVWCGQASAQWSKVEITPGSGFNIGNLYKDGDILWAGGTGKIYRSADGGETWTNVSTGLQSPISNTSGITRLGNRVYASFSGNGNWYTYYTTDEGQNWIIDTAGWKGLAPIQLHTHKEYVLARLESNLIMYKKNSETSWSVLSVPSSHRTPGAMYSIGDSLVLGIGNCALTGDMGLNWTVRTMPATRFPMGFYNGFYQNKDNANEVYSNWQILTSSKNFLLVSRDNQYTWDSVELPVPAPARVTAAWVKGNDVYVAYEGSFAAGDTVAKVFYSSNSGQTWSNITQNLYSLVPFKFHSPNSLLVHNGNLFIGGLTTTGIFKYALGATGINNSKTHKTLNFYPNPANLKVTISNKVDYIQVSDLTGRVIINQTSSTQEIDISQLPQGFYLLTGYNDTEVYTAKFIKD